MVTLSAFADEVSHDLGEQIAFLQQNNIKAIEIRFVNGQNIVNQTDAEVKEVKHALHQGGIQISAIGTPLGKVQLSDSWEDHLELFKRTMEIAHELGASWLRIFSFYPPDGENIDDMGDEVLKRLQTMLALMVGSNLKLIHENEARIFGHSAENCAFLASQLDRAYFGLAYDPANFVWGEKITDPMSSCWPVMAPYVDHVHIKDWKLGDALGAIPGEGDGEIPELLRTLSDTKYSGYLTMEPHLSKGGQFGGETTPEAFRASLQAIRNLCKQTLVLDE